MAITCNNSGISRTANLPNYNAAYTLLFWLKAVSLADTYSFMFGLDTDNYDSIRMNTGLDLEIAASGYAYAGVQTISTGVWYCVAARRNSSASIELFYRTTSAGAFTKIGSTVTSNVAGRSAATTLGIAHDSVWGAELNGAIASIKFWTAALTDAEIISESHSIVPRRFTNLHIWSPCFPGATERLRDYGANGYNWTANGVLADEAGAPVSWGLWTPPTPVFVAAAAAAAGHSLVLGDNLSNRIFGGFVVR